MSSNQRKQLMARGFLYCAVVLVLAMCGIAPATAGHNALRGSGPNQKHAFKDALTQTGSPDPRIDLVCKAFLHVCRLVGAAMCPRLAHRRL